MSKRIYLGLGSNLGGRESHLRRAIELLPAAGVTPLRLSSTYETRPMYVTDQPMFLNMVVEAETDAPPRLLIKRLQRIERQMGRQRAAANGPRNIDIDILLYGDKVIQAPELVVPHPRIEERRFVLEPLAELAPELRHPVTGKSIREMLAGVPAGGVRVYGA